jgi:hypothetical protein
VKVRIATYIGWLCLIPVFFFLVFPRFVALVCTLPDSVTRITTQRYGCQLVELPNPADAWSWMIAPPVLAVVIGLAFGWVVLRFGPN